MSPRKYVEGIRPDKIAFLVTALQFTSPTCQGPTREFYASPQVSTSSSTHIPNQNTSTMYLSRKASTHHASTSSSLPAPHLLSACSL